jgi:Bifunctional DNA primase/polymerase, N-terminal/Family of unknown function (DUF5906)
MGAVMSALDIARDLLARGITPVPVPRGKKGPVIDEWQNLSITAANAEQYFNSAALNVGMQMGPKSGGLADVDLDCKEAVALAPYFLPETNSKYGRPSKRRSHWLYTCPDPDPQAWYKLTDENNAVIVELRLGGGGKGSQSVAPGSEHTSGERYERDEDGERSTRSCAMLHNAVKKIAAATIVVRHWPASNRHEASLRVGGFLARAGWDADNISAFIVAVQKVAGIEDPSHVENGRLAAISALSHMAEGGNTYGLPALTEFFGEAAARKIAKYIGYRDGGASVNYDSQIIAAVEEINENHALVLTGDKAVVMKKEDKTKFRLLKVNAFTQWFANKHVSIGNKSVAVGDCWLQHPERHQYEGIEFAPNAGRSGYYNLWQGFAVEPRQGDCSKFLAHLKENVAGGNDYIYNWTVGWFAHIFQHPEEKLDTALALRGKMGVGKTKVGEHIGSLLGVHYALVSDPRYVMGNFNSHMASLLLLHADEAFWAGDKRGEGKIKDLVSGKSHFIEFKGIDPIYVRNLVRLFVTGNPEWIVPAGFEEWRFGVLDVKETHMQDHAYFAAIDDEMNSGGREALLYHLLNFNLSTVNLRSIPKTAALLEQKIEAATPEQAWWLDMLMMGKLPRMYDLNTCLRDDLFRNYIEHAQKQGARRRAIETRVGMFLNKYVGPDLVSREITYTAGRDDDDNPIVKQGRAYTLPSLTKCRERFAKEINQEIEWGEGNTEWWHEDDAM